MEIRVIFLISGRRCRGFPWEKNINESNLSDVRQDEMIVCVNFSIRPLGWRFNRRKRDTHDCFSLHPIGKLNWNEIFNQFTIWKVFASSKRYAPGNHQYPYLCCCHCFPKVFLEKGLHASIKNLVDVHRTCVCRETWVETSWVAFSRVVRRSESLRCGTAKRFLPRVKNIPSVGKRETW